jgi:adenosylcobyric acid synthase
VVPYLADLGLDEEDGVASEDRPSARRRWKILETAASRALRIGVIALPHMANFTDFDPLALETSVSLAFVEHADEMAAADLLILPGSKQTVDDLQWLERRDFGQELRRLHERGVPIIGICGGFQMLGRSVEDPSGIENQGKPRVGTGLNLLPVRTVLGTEKIARRVRGRLCSHPFGRPFTANTRFEGYEIHVGETFYDSGVCALAKITREGVLGAIADGAIESSGRVMGTYVHGFFDNDDFRHSFLQAARAAADLVPAVTWIDVAAHREARIDRLAGHLRNSLNIDLMKSWLVDPSRRGSL